MQVLQAGTAAAARCTDSASDGNVDCDDDGGAAAQASQPGATLHSATSLFAQRLADEFSRINPSGAGLAGARVLTRSRAAVPGSMADPTWSLRHLSHTTVHVLWSSRSDAALSASGSALPPPSPAQPHLMVERGLAAHFRLPGGSPAYDALLDALPPLVAVAPAALGAAVRLLARRLEAEVAALVSWAGKGARSVIRVFACLAMEVVACKHQVWVPTGWLSS
jgi:hypothetical protein